MQLSYNSVLNLHGSFYLFPSDSVFEDEGVETPHTAAQPAEDGDKPNPAESEATEGEEGEHQATQMHSGTGEDLLVYPALVLVFLSLLSSVFFGLIKLSTLGSDFLSWS